MPSCVRRLSGNFLKELSIENSQKVARSAHPKAPADTRSTGARGQAASFKSSPAARSISRRLSLFGIDRSMRGGGNRHVPQGLDRPLLFEQVDRLDRLHHALT